MMMEQGVEKGWEGEGRKDNWKRKAKTRNMKMVLHTIQAKVAGTSLTSQSHVPLGEKRC